jgi:hypothetical protein
MGSVRIFRIAQWPTDLIVRRLFGGPGISKAAAATSSRGMGLFSSLKAR